MSTITSSVISNRTNVWAATEMLRWAMSVEVLQKFAKPVQMPQNKTTSIKFRRPQVLTAKTIPLVEGVTPTATSWDYDDVSATLRQYGDWSEITDVIQDTNEDPVLKDLTVQHGENIGRTIEALLWGLVKGGTSVFYANGASRGAVNEPITLAKQRKVTRYLKAQKGKKLTRILDSSPNYNQKPVEASYIAVAHTDLENDIRNLAGFKPTAEYGSRKVICEEEIGAVEDVRYVLSPDLDAIPDAGGAKGGGSITAVSTTGTSADIYPIIYLAADAFASIVLRGKGSVKPHIVPVSTATKDDPLAQRGTVGWKTWWAGCRLNETWMSRLEVAVTDL